MRQNSRLYLPLFLIVGLLMTGFALVQQPASAHECVVPESGPWPPCATSGGGHSTTTNSSNDCVIPPAGPWPPCATGGNQTGSTGCVVPSSGPWPPCATGGGYIAPTPVPPTPYIEYAREIAWVEHVVNGNTIIVDINGGLYTVKLIGLEVNPIDDPCGAESAGQLANKVGSQWVELLRDTQDQNQDTQLLRYIFMRGDRFINGEMVVEGYALARNTPPNVRYGGELYQHQITAQTNQVGCFWELSSPLP